MRFSPWIAASLFLASCTSENFNSDADSVLMRMGPVFLTRSELESKIVELGSDYAPYLRTRHGKKTMMDAIVKQKILVRAAIERGLDKESAVREEMRRLKREQEQAFRMYKESLLVDALLTRLRGNELNITDAEIANYYKENQKLFHVRHILVSDARTAEEILARLKKERGNLIQEFAALARQKSLEAQSARQGGKITPFMAGELDESFERAVQALSPGQLGGPVETKVGYHVIFLENTSMALFADEIRGRCRRILEKKKLEALMALWKERYVMEVKDDSLSPFLDAAAEPGRGLRRQGRGDSGHGKQRGHLSQRLRE